MEGHTVNDVQSANLGTLEGLAESYRPASDPDAAVLALDRWWIDAYVQGPDILELGCADGTSTRLLLAKAQTLHIVEGAPTYCELLRQHLPDRHIAITNCLYEGFEPGRTFDDIVFARSLDDVADPVALLTRICGWLPPDGRLHVVVQNAASLHRRLGVALGLLPSLESLTEHSRQLAHRRVYTKALLLSHLQAAKFEVLVVKGYFLKPFDYATLRRAKVDLVTQLIPALYEVSKSVPDELCCQLYALCRPAL